jgi:hypothetical protein
MKLLISVISVAILSGCASAPKPLDNNQVWAQNVLREQNEYWDNIRRVAKAQRERDSQLEVSCASYSKQLRTVTSQEISAIEEKVKNKLKDPWSARFRNISKASQYSECRYGTQYVGEVNAKNSMGGYTGFSVFAIGRDGVTL